MIFLRLWVIPFTPLLRVTQCKDLDLEREAQALVSFLSCGVVIIVSDLARLLVIDRWLVIYKHGHLNGFLCILGLKSNHCLHTHSCASEHQATEPWALRSSLHSLYPSNATALVQMTSIHLLTNESLWTGFSRCFFPFPILQPESSLNTHTSRGTFLFSKPSTLHLCPFG